MSITKNLSEFTSIEELDKWLWDTAIYPLPHGWFRECVIFPESQELYVSEMLTGNSYKKYNTPVLHLWAGNHINMEDWINEEIHPTERWICDILGWHAVEGAINDPEHLEILQKIERGLVNRFEESYDTEKAERLMKFWGYQEYSPEGFYEDYLVASSTSGYPMIAGITEYSTATLEWLEDFFAQRAKNLSVK